MSEVKKFNKWKRQIFYKDYVHDEICEDCIHTCEHNSINCKLICKHSCDDKCNHLQDKNCEELINDNIEGREIYLITNYEKIF